MDPQDDPLQSEPTVPKHQVIKPEEMFTPSVAPPPPPPETPAPVQPQQPAPLPSSDGGQKKKILIILGAGVLLLVLITIIVLITSSGSGKNNNKQQGQQGDQSSGIINEPQAIDIENANNAISSDITGLNDDNDFPPNNLDDLNLQL